MSAIRNFFTNTFKLYGQSFVEQNGRADLTTKFFRGFLPIFMAFVAYTTYRGYLSDNDPKMLKYWDLEIDRERTPNFSEEKLKQWQQYSIKEEREVNEKIMIKNQRNAKVEQE